MKCPSCGGLVDRAGGCPRCDGDGDTLAGIQAALLPADRVAGRFELKSRLGQGSIGLVYRARDQGLGIDVALKLLRSSTPQDLERLKREMLVARRIRHPNVVRIAGFGVSGADAWVAMELLEGGSLADRLTDGPMPLDEGGWTALWIAQGLKAVHAAGIIHRDLKPANILFDLAGRPKLADFGLARLAGSRGDTVSGSITGTPLYLSPEVVEGDEVTARSDVYSLGAVMFEIFSGRPPFQETDLLKLIEQHLHQAPPRLRDQRRDVDPEVDALVGECLEKAASSRPDSATVVARLCRVLGAEEEVSEHRPAAPAHPLQPGPLAARAEDRTVVKLPWKESRSSAPGEPRPVPRPFLMRFLLGTLVLVAIALAGYEWARLRPFP